MSAETVDQYDLLRATFEKLGIEFNEFVGEDDWECMDVQIGDHVTEFWFQHGSFTRVDIIH